MASRHFPAFACAVAAMMVLFLVSTVHAADKEDSADPSSPFDVSFGVAFKSDSVVQGRSQTSGKPAVQPWTEISVNDLFYLSLIHISEPTRQAEISYAVFC